MDGSRQPQNGRVAVVTGLVSVALLGALLATVRDAKAIPAWARKYNADCTMCHYPVIPRLNSFGQQFRRAGYRTPDEFNKEQDVTKVGDFFATRLRGRFGYENKEGQIERSQFTLHDATFFYAGAFSKNLSAFVEAEMEPEETGVEIGLTGHLMGVFGTSNRYFSIRGGQMHPLQRWGFGGFDRPSGISTNPVHSTSLTRGGAGFNLNQDQKGVEVSYVQGPGRLFGQILNGFDDTASGTRRSIDIDPQKDYLVAYEHILDDIASGFTLFYYKGTRHSTVDDPGAPTAIGNRFDFTRLGLNVNKIFPVGFGFFELQGGFVRSWDHVPGTVGPDVQSNAFYVESQQVLKDTWLTFIERYSLIDQNAGAKNTVRQDYMLGVLAPVQTWARLAAEYTYTDNRATGNSDHAALAEVQFNW